MSFVITVFAELVQKFPTWDELHAWLVSEEGGSLRVIGGSAAEASPYVIIRYTKGVSDITKEHVRAFRSVVWNTETNRPVSVAPSKAEAGSPVPGLEYNVSDFVDGVMINAFREDATAPVQIASRTSLGARTSFYTARSFGDMFWDSVSKEFLEENLGEDSFVSFVLQHPEHRTVAEITSPRLYAVNVGVVFADGRIFNYPLSSASTDSRIQKFRTLSPHVHVTGLRLNTEQHAFDIMRKFVHGYTTQGLVFQDTLTGRRWRLRNPNFVAVRTLRGAENNAMARFLRLRRDGQIKDYLKHFHEDSNAFWGYEQLLRQRTQELYQAYVDMNKLKKKTMRDLPFTLRPHVYALHGQYLASLPKEGQEGKPISVNKDRVIAYVNGLTGQEQLRLMEGDRPAAAVAAVPAAAQ